MIHHRGIDQNWRRPAQGERLLLGACESRLGQGLQSSGRRQWGSRRRGGRPSGWMPDRVVIGPTPPERVPVHD